MDEHNTQASEPSQPARQQGIPYDTLEKLAQGLLAE